MAEGRAAIGAALILCFAPTHPTGERRSLFLPFLSPTLTANYSASAMADEPEVDEASNPIVFFDVSLSGEPPFSRSTRFVSELLHQTTVCGMHPPPNFPDRICTI